MAGGNPKASAHKPSSSSSHRKSRWESGSNPPADKKSGDPKPPNSSSTPKTPNSDSKQAPASTSGSSHPKPPVDSVPISAAAPAHPPVAGAPLRPDPGNLGPPPPPQYGFHMLDRRTIVLADGSVRSYFALPPDYQDFPPPPPRPMDPAGRFLPMGPGHGLESVGPGMGPTGLMSPEGFRGEREDPYLRGRHQDYWNSLGLDGRGPPEGPMKRKYSEEDERDRREDRDRRDGNDIFARQRQQLLQYGNPSLNPNGYPLGGDRREYLAGPSSPFRRDVKDPIRGDEMRSSKYMRIGGVYEGFSRQGGVVDTVGLKHHNVDQNALRKAFIQFVKLINESASQRRLYLEDGKQGPLRCLACGRFGKLGRF